MVEWFNRSLLQLLRTYVDKQKDWEKYLHLVFSCSCYALMLTSRKTGRNICIWFYLPTIQHHILPLVVLHSYSCLDGNLLPPNSHHKILSMQPPILVIFVLNCLSCVTWLLVRSQLMMCTRNLIPLPKVNLSGCLFQ